MGPTRPADRGRPAGRRRHGWRRSGSCGCRTSGRSRIPPKALRGMAPKQPRDFHLALPISHNIARRWVGNAWGVEVTVLDSAAAITVNGIRLEAIEKGRGRPLLFLHPGIGLE